MGVALRLFDLELAYQSKQLIFYQDQKELQQKERGADRAEPFFLLDDVRWT